MEIYQLCFPDGDGYPIVPGFTFKNIPSKDLLNECLKKDFENARISMGSRFPKNPILPKFNDETYKLLLDGKTPTIGGLSQFYCGWECALIKAQVIDNLCSKCTDENGNNIGNMYICPYCGREVD